MKIVRLLLGLSLVFSLLPLSANASEEKGSEYYYAEDIWDSWAYDEIDDFLSANIIDGYVKYDSEGYPIVNVNPESNITRAQFTKIIVNAMNLKLNGSGQTFSDVKSTDPLYPYIQIASSHGIIKGRDGRFDPNQKINREQMAVMIHRAFKSTVSFEASEKTFTDVPAGYWAEKEINEAAASGIIKGYGDIFKPRNLATRAQGIVMIHRALRQETTHMPNENDMLSVVNDHFDQERQLFSAKNFDALSSLYNQNGTGYYKAISLENVQYMEEAESYGDAIEIEPVGNFTVSIETINNRYAEVYVEGLEYKESYYSAGSEEYSDVMDYSGFYSLKLDDSGEWKIYNYRSAE
ncbi:S-layer homology domain-containing protein [Rossellomorea sp. KS-H15a]|uniref:S-layer homology domain-containing protein n=1 Tax=Rossellomorea sp. KS-H15a TaxID=2963940 RepID=UPI0020C737E6|nr:S-layer homology domain-containing protein [Rossellomorea sp. KS-H15a]UTE77353.1 S-layer homology domain-containing protein [Rossellomorea sp. KS-H15a]